MFSVVIKFNVNPENIVAARTNVIRISNYRDAGTHLESVACFLAHISGLKSVGKNDKH